MDGFRSERDPLGDKQIPDAALYGVQTARALEHFQISGVHIHPDFITAFAEIKMAAAEANLEMGSLERDLGEAIVRAATELRDGKWREHFCLDVFQAGAGTSYNMNVNEVIANRALELLGASRGDHHRLGPNDHVNKSQSTNDTMVTAMRITAVRLARGLEDALAHVADSFEAKGREFGDAVKAGRTHLHDATPMTLGEEFHAYGRNVRRASEALRYAAERLLDVTLGGTAVGNGVNTHPDYAGRAIGALRRITGLPLREAADKVQLTQSMGDFVLMSGAMRLAAVELGKIANDLRLL
ncbi:MAG TPA: lyase family protein, partial [Vicinamibacterales bacterium]|nr:lyase family protein [Vicinamibacterales bacterium]